jgi:hypothetical protein
MTVDTGQESSDSNPKYSNESDGVDAREGSKIRKMSTHTPFVRESARPLLYLHLLINQHNNKHNTKNENQTCTNRKASANFFSSEA